MATRAQRNQGNGDKYAAAPDIASNFLSSLVTAVTKAITNSIVNATVPVPVMPKTITYFSSIDMYDNYSFDMKTKERYYQWHLTTKIAEG